MADAALPMTEDELTERLVEVMTEYTRSVAGIMAAASLAMAQQSDLNKLINRALTSPDPNTDAGDLTITWQDDMPMVEVHQAGKTYTADSAESALLHLLGSRG